jgi:hypothetical protein
MFTRNHKTLAITASLVIVLNFYSCKKYEDGPAFTLKSKNSRLVGEWEVVEIDGIKLGSGSFSVDLNLEFDKDGDFSFNQSYSYYGYSYSYSYKGDWEWNSNKESLEISMPGSPSEDWDILRLTKDELWFEDSDGSKYECEKAD